MLNLTFDTNEVVKIPSLDFLLLRYGLVISLLFLWVFEIVGAVVF
jgi:hypothetical protein